MSLLPSGRRCSNLRTGTENLEVKWIAHTASQRRRPAGTPSPCSGLALSVPCRAEIRYPKIAHGAF